MNSISCRPFVPQFGKKKRKEAASVTSGVSAGQVDTGKTTLRVSGTPLLDVARVRDALQEGFEEALKVPALDTENLTLTFEPDGHNRLRMTVTGSDQRFDVIEVIIKYADSKLNPLGRPSQKAGVEILNLNA